MNIHDFTSKMNEIDKTTGTAKRMLLKAYTPANIISTMALETIDDNTIITERAKSETLIFILEMIDSMLWNFAEKYDDGCLPRQIDMAISALRDKISDEYNPWED